MDTNKYCYIDIKLSPDEIRDLKRGLEKLRSHLAEVKCMYDESVREVLQKKIDGIESLRHRLMGIMMDNGVEE